MSARDDYPIHRVQQPVRYEIDPGRWKDMCDEIDQLRDLVASLKAQLGLDVGARRPGDRVL